MQPFVMPTWSFCCLATASICSAKGVVLAYSPAFPYNPTNTATMAGKGKEAGEQASTTPLEEQMLALAKQQKDQATCTARDRP